MLPQSSDTPIEIEKIQISMIRRESLAKKMVHIASLTQTSRQFSKRAIKRANPTLNEPELNRLLMKYWYDLNLKPVIKYQLPTIQEGLKKQMTMKNEMVEAIKPLIEVFNQLGILYYIGGSVASSIYGMPRATQDIDLVTHFKSEHIAHLEQALESTYYIDQEMILKAIINGTSFNLIHLETMMKIDIFLLKNDPYHQIAFGRKKEELFDEQDHILRFYIASCEDVILTKLDWFRLGGGISEQQWRDIQGVLKIQQESLDIDYLLTWARELELTNLLEKAFQDAGLMVNGEFF